LAAGGSFAGALAKKALATPTSRHVAIRDECANFGDITQFDWLGFAVI
jgi:hypothetical protein